MAEALEKKALARRLAPQYVKNYVEIARLCDESIDPTGELLGYVREEAAALGLSPERIKAREVLDRLCADPEMWATHGCPPEHKLKKLEDEFTAAFEHAK